MNPVVLSIHPMRLASLLLLRMNRDEEALTMSRRVSWARRQHHLFYDDPCQAVHDACMRGSGRGGRTGLGPPLIVSSYLLHLFFMQFFCLCGVALYIMALMSPPRILTDGSILGAAQQISMHSYLFQRLGTHCITTPGYLHLPEIAVHCRANSH
jgi:hypothetical protein